MRCHTLILVWVAVVCAGGCTTTGGIPATAPSTSADAPTSTSSATTTTVTSTASEAVTTTMDRLTEITAIFEDLERRRLDAIYTSDVEAFTALFADTPYLDRSLEVFDLVAPGTPPTVSIEILEVLRDDETCIAAWASATVGDNHTDPVATVLVDEGGVWKIAYVGGERRGWQCEGPHPLSP